jgi:hypothetical protein
MGPEPSAHERDVPRVVGPVSGYAVAPNTAGDGPQGIGGAEGGGLQKEKPRSTSSATLPNSP